jgi:uncharacterized LabA/DUF88 family protein
MPRTKQETQNPADVLAQPAQAAVSAIQYTSQRVGIFIDVQNMYYSAKNLFGAKVNFINVVRGAIRNRQLIRAIAYVVETPQQHEVRFLDALRLQGIELKERDLQVFSSGMKKADWDVGLAVDAIRISDVLDVIVLVSGDGDYLPLVEYLQNKGRKVEVMAFRNTSSSKLVEMADAFYDLADPAADYMIQGYGGAASTGGAPTAPAAAPASASAHATHQTHTPHTGGKRRSSGGGNRTKRTIM